MRASEFRFKDKNTVIHSLDSRTKIFMVGALSSILVTVGFWRLVLVGGLILLLGWKGRVNFIKGLLEVKPFLVLLAFVFLAHSFSGPGPPLFSIFGFALTVSGMVSGCIVILRLALIVLLGLLYSSTTPPKATKAAFEWFLRPFPFNERVFGAAVAIGIRFFPQIREETERIQEAQKARLGDEAGVLRKLKNFASLLVIRIFERAQKVSMAMDARCYSADRPSRLQLSASRCDYISLIPVILFMIPLLLPIFFI